MTTDRSDKLHADWRASTEKFDYFILGVVGALCAFIGQGYKPSKLGLNSGSIELIALLTLVLAVISGFRRIEQTLLVTALNHRQIHAYEVRGGMLAKMQHGQILINEATGHLFNQDQIINRVEELNKTIASTAHKLEKAKTLAHRYYKLRNSLTVIGFLLLLTARVWSAYA